MTHINACPDVLQLPFAAPVVECDGCQATQRSRAQPPCHVDSSSHPEASVERCDILVTGAGMLSPHQDAHLVCNILVAPLAVTNMM